MVPFQGESVILKHYNRLSSEPFLVFRGQKTLPYIQDESLLLSHSPFYVFTQDKTWVQF